MNKQLTSIALLTATMATCSVSAEDAPGKQTWIGEWVNTDAETRSTTRLKIAVEDGTLFVHGFGKCHPTDCDWGITKLHLCTVTGSKSDVVGFASWDQQFKDHHIVLRIKGDKLIVQTFDIYKDKSGRTNRSAKETFAKTDKKDAEQ